MVEYIVKYYCDSRTGRVPLADFLDMQTEKVREKIFKYIEYLRLHNGYFDEPYSKHIVDKIRELRVDFGKNRYRIFYFTVIDKRIILLHGFKKATQKTPQKEINRALHNYADTCNNLEFYE